VLKLLAQCVPMSRVSFVAGIEFQPTGRSAIDLVVIAISFGISIRDADVISRKVLFVDDHLDRTEGATFRDVNNSDALWIQRPG